MINESLELLKSIVSNQIGYRVDSNWIETVTEYLSVLISRGNS
jgi:hypothetical protein